MIQTLKGVNLMPVYEYYCSSCKWRFEQLQPMSRSETPADCPECGSSARKALSVFAAVSRGADGYALPIGGGGGACCSGGNCACAG